MAIVPQVAPVPRGSKSDHVVYPPKGFFYLRPGYEPTRVTCKVALARDVGLVALGV